jgi:hypothetical protein
MKKILSLAILALTTTIASAQINQGQWMVGGDANLSSSKTEDSDDDSRVTDFSINPNVGYFFIDNLAGGLRLSFNSSKTKGADEAFTSFAGAPFLRYYFLPAAQKVNIFAEASYGFGSTDVSLTTDDKESFNFWSLQAGPAIFLNEHAALEFGVFYNSTGGDLYGGELRNNTFGINVGFQIHLGAGGGSRTTTSQ